METKKLIHLLKDPSLLQSSDVSILQSQINAYPYFQTLKALQLKVLKDNGSFVYNQKLKETAAYTTDREVLFNFISSKQFNTKASSIKEIVKPQDTTEPATKNNSLDSTPKLVIESNNGSFKSINNQSPKGIEDIDLKPQSPLEFSKNETHSFVEWLKLSTISPIIREEKKTTKRKFIESPLIDSFLKNNPKISPIKKSTQVANLATNNTVSSEDLMTETLAKVYLAQGNYKKAIQAYKILSLKNPEKSGLFADQIRAIKKLQDNNK